MGKGGDAHFKTSTTAGTEDQATKRKFTLEEVAKHRTPEDAWVIYHDKVYDVSDWYEHPGGAVIFTHAGDDMTDIFAAFHAAGSHNVMKKFYIGDLVKETTGKDARQLAFEKGYRDLRSKLAMLGLFKSSKLFYAYKYVTNLSLWAFACYLIAVSDSVLVHMAAAVILALFMQQCGWLAHDHLHHQVFKNRRYGDYGGLFWGGVAQGFSVQWWKNKHNGHHAVTNLHGSTALAQDGDPDIDTMPLLAWSLKQAQSYRELAKDGSDSAVVKFFIRHQAVLYAPILLLARLSWMRESVKAAFNLGASSKNGEVEMERKGLQYPFWEKAVIILHYAWTIAVISGYGRFSVAYSLALFLFMTCSCGFFLGVVFGLGHNGMATYDADARPDFWKLQVTTTRNIIGGHGIPQAVVDWLCGGLQYQVEHHLFPTIPRHNLARAHEFVVSFCKEWGVSFHEADMIDGNIEVLQHLAKVSDQFVIDFVRDGPTM
jgi:cytochrome b involved in lipid metabolism/fatty acid desaturase